MLQARRARERGYFVPGYIDRILDEHLSGTRSHALRLWQLLVFELWHQRYLDPAAVGTRPRPQRGASISTDAQAVL
jgi:hypothetical protein